MSITLDEDLQEFVRTQAGRGGFTTPDQYVSDLIREQQTIELARQELNEMIQEGLAASDSALSHEEVLADLRTRARAAQ